MKTILVTIMALYLSPFFAQPSDAAPFDTPEDASANPTLCRVHLSPTFKGVFRMRVAHLLAKRNCEVVSENFNYDLGLYHGCVMNERAQTRIGRWHQDVSGILLDSVSLVELPGGRKFRKSSVSRGLYGPVNARQDRRLLNAITGLFNQAGQNQPEFPIRNSTSP